MATDCVHTTPKAEITMENSIMHFKNSKPEQYTK